MRVFDLSILCGIFVILCSIFSSCSLQDNSRGDYLDLDRVYSQLESECETQLMYVAGLLEDLDSRGDIPESKLLEVKELFNMSEELYLRREFSLALELLEEAIEIIEERSD